MNLLPTLADVEDACREVAAVHACTIVVHSRAAQRALEEAEHLVHDSLDLPAALHFAFSRQPRMFSGFAAEVLAQLLTSQAAELGFKVLGSEAELLARLRQSPESVQDAQNWFAGRVMPFGG